MSDTLGKMSIEILADSKKFTIHSAAVISLDNGIQIRLGDNAVSLTNGALRILNRTINELRRLKRTE